MLTENNMLAMAAELMAWDDEEWTGNSLNIVRDIVAGGSAEDAREAVKDAFWHFIYGRETDEIVAEDLQDHFDSDEDYNQFIEWACELQQENR